MHQLKVSYSMNVNDFCVVTFRDVIKRASHEKVSQSSNAFTRAKFYLQNSKISKQTNKFAREIFHAKHFSVTT